MAELTEKKKKKKKSAKLTPKDMEKIIKKLTSKGKEKGFVTDAEINDIFPRKPGTKELSALYKFLDEKNIEIVDS